MTSTGTRREFCRQVVARATEIAIAGTASVALAGPANGSTKLAIPGVEIDQTQGAVTIC